MLIISTHIVISSGDHRGIFCSIKIMHTNATIFIGSYYEHAQGQKIKNHSKFHSGLKRFYHYCKALKGNAYFHGKRSASRLLHKDNAIFTRPAIKGKSSWCLY